MRKNERAIKIVLQSGLIGYTVLFACSVIFTQAFRSYISALLHILVITLPLLELLCFYLSCKKLYFHTDKKEITAAKNERIKLASTIKNEGIFPISFASVTVQTPNDSLAGYDKTVNQVTIPPLSEISCSFDLSFSLMGEYTLGAGMISAYDFFKLIRVDIRTDIEARITVLPDSLPPISSLPLFREDGGEISGGYELGGNTEHGDLREFVAGDSIKNIHWKLSSKTETIQVRKRLPEVKGRLLVLCDLERHKPSHPFPDSLFPFSDDRVCEEALSFCLDAVQRGFAGSLVRGCSTESDALLFNDFSDIDDIAALAPSLSKTDREHCCRLALDGIATEQNASVVLVLSYLSPQSERTVNAFIDKFGARESGVCICSLAALLDGDAKESYEKELEGFEQRLRSEGVLVETVQRGGAL